MPEPVKTHLSPPHAAEFSLCRSFATTRGSRALAGLALALLLVLASSELRAAGFTRLVSLPAPRIVVAADSYSGWPPAPVANLIDGNPETEYASGGKGTETFVEFDFLSPVRLAGFRHQDRADATCTITASELVLLDSARHELGRVPVVHSGILGGVVVQPFLPAVEVRYVRWQVTKLGGGVRDVGGAEISFFGAGVTESSPTALTVTEAIALPLADRTEAGLRQSLKLHLAYPYAEPIDTLIQVGDQPAEAIRLSAGLETLDLSIPVSAQERRWSVTIADAAQNILASRPVAVPPFRELTVYVVPHSHVDIGYTEPQADIEEKQVNNLLAGIELADRTASYPEGARFVWNLECLWPADLLLQRLNPEQRDRFFAAVRQGRVALNGMYANTLTGLCRPEELVRLFHFATQLRTQIGAPLDTAMISDIPGYTWGTVTAMAQAGIKYFSPAPNYFDRIGDILFQTENKPFWWVGPSGRERVLVWVPSRGYALAHLIHRLSPQWVVSYAAQLTRTGYPFNVVYVRWAGHGDNGVPDPAICDFVRDWNARHAWPHFVIGSARDALRALEQEHGAQLPERRGDWTPYWEDGAGSSALETAMNRASSDRLAQAEALWAMQDPQSYPVKDFATAMRSLHLFDEHTWGAWCSVVAPSRRETLEQWAVKHAYAATAETQSHDLLARALSLATVGALAPSAVDVFNANSWPRTDVVVLPMDFAAAGDLVTDEHGQPVPSQRLTSGELVLLASDVPPLSARRYTIAAGKPHVAGNVLAEGTTLDNGLIKVALDPRTGGIVELRAKDIAANLADPGSGEALNEYIYFNGDDPTKALRNGAVTTRVKEKGPLVASLVVTSDAPGCFILSREIKLVAGQDHVELSNFIDKQRLVARDYKSPEGKESVNFAFPFNVPGGQVQLEVPFGIVRPDVDQIPGSCKNWLIVNRWADVANTDFGITWVSLDTPLVQIGGLTANLLNSQTDPAVWRRQIGPTQKLYAWVMNNHWGTNFRAYQEGPHTFRFLLRPHGAYDPAAASRLAIAASQPLLPVRARGEHPPAAPRLRIESPDVIVTGFKPSDDGRAIIVRLWGAAGKDVTTRLSWAAPAPRRVSLSDTSEQPLREVGETISVPAWGLITLRAELP